MLNYANLNDVEFEALCRDIMERKLNVGLRRFAPGKDKGVDLTDDVDRKNMIVQVKHYVKSSVSALVDSLKGELKKVKQWEPERYYICCSRELSQGRVNELYQHFKEYMESDRQIITILEIDDFLKQPENRDILKKHFKLWLDDTGILEELYNDAIFVDCETFLADVEELHKLFVRTSAFDRALNALENNHTLCIIGDPGVGKSITSKMLVLHYAAQGYRVRYTSDVADLTTLKASLRREPEAKEIILLDDCFGQAYFEMKSGQSTELIHLIKYVKHRPNKILILNSRVTIFQEARERQRELGRSLEREEFQVFVLDMTNLLPEEKAKILYNHLAFSGIPDAYFEDIKAGFRYRKIIEHPNYNPRIMEFVCTPSRYKTVPPDEFYGFIQKHLDNPKEMWADEYDDRLQPVDRILLQTVYSLTNTAVDIELVRQCFERRIADIPTIDKTVDQFQRSLMRLSEGFITIADRYGKRSISMRNPSVNDFLNGRLTEGSLERTELIRSICAPEQLRLLPEEQRHLHAVELLQSGEVETFVFLQPEDKTAFIGNYILLAELYIDAYRTEFQNYLTMRIHSHYQAKRFMGPFVLERILQPGLWKFYDLTCYFTEKEHLYALLSVLDLERAADFVEKCDPYFQGDAREQYIEQAEIALHEAVENFCDVDAEHYDDNVEEAVRQSGFATPDGWEFDEDEAVSTLEEWIQTEAFDELKTIIRSLPKDFSHLLDGMDENDIYVSGADYLVEDYISNPPGFYESDEDYEKPYDDGYSPIDAIFQR